jgi:UDP-GlcNAc3NAcA epimerase
MPEEINRIVTDHLSALLFAPTLGAVTQLHNEGLSPASIYQTGDVMYDAALCYGGHSDSISRIVAELGLNNSAYALCTVHRAENTDSDTRLRAIVDILSKVSMIIPVILPLHPRTRNALNRIGVDGSMGSGVRVLPPAGYLDMIALQKNAAIIITDSGGVQKEAFFFRVPCVTLRHETEWQELVQLGWNRLVDLCDPAGSARIILESIGRCGAIDAEPYGRGNAAEMIAATLAQRLIASV